MKTARRPAAVRGLLTALAMLAAGALLGACDDESDGPDEVRISEADNGRSVNLSAGDRLAVALKGNPTTGFQWQLDSVDAAVLAPVGEPEYTPDSDAVGAGGTYIFRFEARAAGETILRLTYLRAWEDNPPEETFEVTVVVE